MQRWSGASLALVLACACGGPSNPGGDAGGDDDAQPIDATSIDADLGPFEDFPPDPVIDTGGAPNTPPNAGDLFGDPTSGTPSGGPCLVEPEIGTLYPNTWLRPRFSWVASGGQNLFEVRITTPTQSNPLVVYTTATRVAARSGRRPAHAGLFSSVQRFASTRS